MLYFLNENTDPYFNIAVEEYLLKEYNEDILMFYINEPSVIIGKHQNTLAEINYHYIVENKIKVVRRISGGGTVYHDSGNLNFSFITNGQEGNLVNFRRFAQPVIEALSKLGVNAQFEGKNDIRVSGLKISGNAEHIYKNRTLHHGTLLFSANLNNLSEALRSSGGTYVDNAVKSIRSKVANVQSFTSELQDIFKFKDFLAAYLSTQNNSFIQTRLKNQELEKIHSLIKTKYETWEWNYGYSPDYEFLKDSVYENHQIGVRLIVSKGIIREGRITKDGKNLDSLNESLTDTRHEFSAISSKLQNSLTPEVSVWNFF